MHNGSFKRVEILFVKNIKVVCMWYIRLVYFLYMVFVCEFLLPSMGRPLVSKASREGLPGEGRGGRWGPLRLPQVFLKPRKMHSRSSAVHWRRHAELG